jgi:hypothetical protein
MFSSLRRDNELFWELKKVKNGNRSKFRKTVFYKQILDFHALPKFYVTHQIYEILSKSLVPTLQQLFTVVVPHHPVCTDK